MEIQQNIPLAPYTTFGIGGLADYFVVVSTLDELKEAVVYAKENDFPYFLLGTGANILVGDRGYRGMVIKNEAKDYAFDGNLLTAQSGAKIDDLMQLSKEKGLSGLEDFAGIISTVGGALWQNLHFLNPDRTKTVYIADILKEATVLHEDGSIEKVDVSYFQFGYDKSILHTSKDIVLSATLQLAPKIPEEIQKTIDANIQWRKVKHPENGEHCSAGSVFKKLEGFGAGRLIEQVGLKGKQIGGAQVSTTHANFIINTGSASAKDVRELIALIQDTIKKELDLTMEVEISFVGEF